MFLEIFLEALRESLSTMAQIALIVFPILMVLRFAREAQIVDKISNYFEPLTRRLFMSKEATFPLIVGITFGLTYGAGVIVQAAKEGRLTGRDMLLINVFLGLNHAIFEDTLLFTAIGANPFWLLTTRFLLAIIFTYFIGKWLVAREKNDDGLLKINS
jgi:hypothetical protein